MKKIALLLMALVMITIYSCQKENVSVQKKTISGTLSSKRDTVPPDATLLRVLKDTVPPDASSLVIKKK
jgi:uncharacterized lipoprotein YbaY